MTVNQKPRSLELSEMYVYLSIDVLFSPPQFRSVCVCACVCICVCVCVWPYGKGDKQREFCVSIQVFDETRVWAHRLSQHSVPSPHCYPTHTHTVSELCVCWVCMCVHSLETRINALFSCVFASRANQSPCMMTLGLF